MATLPANRDTLKTHEELVRSGNYTSIFFVPHGQSVAPYAGIELGASPTQNKPIGVICVSQGMDDVPLVADNQRDILFDGKKTISVTDGYRLDRWTLNIAGNAVKTMMAFINQDWETNQILEHKGTYNLAGTLIVIGSDSDGTMKRTDVFVDVKCEITTLPGSTPGGDTLQPVVFYSDSVQVYTSFDDVTAAVEVWRDDASGIVNAVAPDGILVAFTMGTGNSSTAGPPTALIARPNETGFKQYFVKLTNDAADADTADIASFVPGTGVLTFNTAPIDGATLLAIYFIDSGTDDIPLNLGVNDQMSMQLGYEDMTA